MILFRDLEVSTVRPDWKAVEAGLVDDFAYDSRGHGLATPWRATTGSVRRKLNLPVVAHGLDAIGELRRFLDRRRGRQLAVWQPSFLGDFTLVADAAAASDELTVAGHRFSTRYALGNQYKYIALVDRAGRAEPHAVTAVNAAGADDVLTLASGLATAVVADETVCCQLLLARLLEDEHELEYVGSDVVTTTLGYLECPAEYPPVTALSVAETLEYGTRPVFLYLISDGTTTLRRADFGVDLAAAAATWQAADIAGGELVSTLDMLGDEVTVTLRSDDPDLPLLDYLDALNFRNYSVDILLANRDSLTLLDLNAPEHRGRIEAVEDAGGGELRLSISSLFRLNERRFPRLNQQRHCNLDTFSTRCGADIATFTTTTTIAVINADPPYVEAAAFGDKATAESDPNWFALGKVTVGDEVRICTGQDGDRLYLNLPFRRAAVTNAISAVAGDDKRVATCDGKFNRLPDHLGLTFQPPRNPQLQALELPKRKAGKK